MRYAALLLPFLFACGAKETPAVDSTSTTAMAAPALMTEADVAGSWAGTTMGLTSDSVLARWTNVCGAGPCKGSNEGAKDTVVWTYTIAGDSAMGSAAAYADPMVKAKITDHWTVHLKDGKVVGTGENRLASKPDSVVFRYRFEGARKP